MKKEKIRTYLTDYDKKVVLYFLHHIINTMHQYHGNYRYKTRKFRRFYGQKGTTYSKYSSKYCLKASNMGILKAYKNKYRTHVIFYVRELTSFFAEEKY